MTFPRAAALAEVAWSPAERLDWQSFSARLPAQLERYDALGIRYARARRTAALAAPVGATQSRAQTCAATSSCCRSKTMRRCRASAPSSWSTS